MIEFDDLEDEDLDESPLVLGERGLSPALVAWLGQQLKPPWWHKAAACRGADSDLFFIERGATSKAAKALCAQCPVLNACLTLAIEDGFAHGIFGGMSPRERRAEKRRRRLAA